uniref:Uncharacterized protein n=1 Tax=Phlebotomus papatasi TaxID=29031 RepID=A0A1B0DQC7_PHLPP
EKGAQKTYITDTERRAIVAIIVDHLKTTRRDITHHDKSLYAKAAVKMFPVLGNNTGIGEVQDSFYNKRNYTGYIPNRLKGLQRDVKKRKRAFGEDLDEKPHRKSLKKQSIATSEAGSNNNLNVNVNVLSSIKADLELLNPTKDREEIIRKTLETRELRDAYEPNDEPIWIQCDFEDRFPEASPKLKKFFVEKREKIFEVQKQSTKKLTDSMKEWHEDVQLLACLLVLSGTTTSGHKGISRISEERALDEIIGLVPPDSVPPKVADKPKILAQGSSKKEVYRFYINVGTFLIETQNTFIDALDLYFKSFHVFKIEPLPSLKNLFDFIDQIVLGISEKENCSSNVAFLNNLLNI